MCRIFADQDPARYAYQTRSLRLAGHVTSLRLEAAFWDILEAIAEREGTTVSAFISTLYSEITVRDIAITNFTSLLRCACLTFLEAESAAQKRSASAAGLAARLSPSHT